MKKIVLTFMLLLLSVGLSANETDRAKLASDMRTMIAAVELIQKGGFYSKPEMMRKGVEKLKKGLVSLESTDASKYLPESKSNAAKFANKRARMIEMYADDLVASVNENNMDEALEDYVQIVKQCSSCHLRIRPY